MKNIKVSNTIPAKIWEYTQFPFNTAGVYKLSVSFSGDLQNLLDPIWAFTTFT